jgi:hypothetical protein
MLSREYNSRGGDFKSFNIKVEKFCIFCTKTEHFRYAVEILLGSASALGIFQSIG